MSHASFQGVRLPWSCRALRTLLLAVVLLARPTFSAATHSAGADLTYKCLGGNNYLVEVTFYRDCAGISAPLTIPVSYQSTSCGFNLIAMAAKISGTGTEITAPCAAASTSCNGGSITGIQKFIYQAIVSLPTACTDWIFSYQVCCRNCAITTIKNPCAAGSNLYVEALLNNQAAPCNNSPYFANDPVAFVCTGQSFNYNPGIIEPDGDSLAFELIAPKTGAQSHVTYVTPYSPANPFLSNTPLKLDSVSGQITIMPGQAQIGIVTMRISEYRNGKKAGSVIRDMQIYTSPCANALPAATGINGTNVFTAEANPGIPLCFTIHTIDSDATQNLSLAFNNQIPGAQLTANTGVRPVITFCWTPAAADVRNTPYTFTVSVRDNACPVNGIQVFAYNLFVKSKSLSVTSKAAACHGESSGTAEVINAAPGSNFLWSNGATASSIKGLAAGTYTVNVNEPGNSQSFTVTVTEPDVLTPGILPAVNVTCHGGTNGSLASQPAGGTTPYDYLWNTGNTGSSINGLPAATYSLTVTDANGCTASQSKTVTQPAETLISSINALTHVSCFGGGNGAATVSASGGTPPYTYRLNGQPSTPSLAGLAAGNHTLEVTDELACMHSQQLYITQPPELQAIVTQTANVTCHGGQNGAIQVAVSGGKSPYQYAWSNGATTANIQSLAAGTYQLTVYDQNLCTTTCLKVVTQPADGISVIADSILNVSCFAGNSGAVYVSAKGGNPPYSYQWNTGITTPAATNLVAGTYSLTVSDANGCTVASNHMVSQPPGAMGLHTKIISQVSCHGGNNGAIDLTVNGGTSPYQYLWSNGATTEDLSQVAAGTYGVTVTDAAGCRQTMSVALVQPASTLKISSVVIDETNCAGGNNGAIDITPSAGDQQYAYRWSNGATTEDLTGIAAGTYTVTVSDAGGCEAVASAQVLLTATRIILSKTTQPANCLRNQGGAISLVATGGKPPYAYRWSTGDTTQQISNVFQGNYEVTVTDAEECKITSSYSIADTGTFSARAVGPTEVCIGELVMMVADTVFDGSYQWYYDNERLTGSVHQVYLAPKEGFYRVSVESSCGSFNSEDIRVGLLTVANYTISPNVILCPGENTRLEATGGVAYQWSPATGLDHTDIPNPLAGPSQTTTYHVEVTGDNNCKATGDVLVTVLCDSINIPSGFSPNNDGINDFFEIEGLENYPWTKIWIYNRRGALIFKSGDYNNRWAGESNVGNDAGKTLPSGTYYYVVDLNDGNKPLTGYIVMKR